MSLPTPDLHGMIFQDDQLYVCLASHPLTAGHTVIVWKKPVTDLHLLERKEYEYLMEIVNRVRNAMLQALSVEKVYLMYMDEANQVHWHLVPRYNEKGVNILAHEPGELSDYIPATLIANALAVNSQ